MNDDLMRLLTFSFIFFTAPETTVSTTPKTSGAKTSGAHHNSVDIYTLGAVAMATLHSRKLQLFWIQVNKLDEFFINYRSKFY